jgi:pentatricopeptide repeat protein
MQRFTPRLGTTFRRWSRSAPSTFFLSSSPAFSNSSGPSGSACFDSLHHAWAQAVNDAPNFVQQRLVFSALYDRLINRHIPSSRFPAIPAVSNLDLVRSSNNIEYSRQGEDFVPQLHHFTRLFVLLQKHHSNVMDDKLDSVFCDYVTFISVLATFHRPLEELVRIMEQLQLQLPSRNSNQFHTKNFDKITTSLIHATLLHNRADLARQILDVALKRAWLRPKSSAHSRLTDAILKSYLNQSTSSVKLATQYVMDAFQRWDRSMNIDWVKSFMIHFNRQIDIEKCQFWLNLGERLSSENRLFGPFDADGERPRHCFHLTPLYNLLVDTYCKAGDIRSAVAVLEKMKASKDPKRIFPNAFTYGSLMQLITDPALSRRAHHSEDTYGLTVSQLLQDMKKLGIYPMVENWNVLLWNHAKNGRVQRVERLFEQMQKDLRSASSSSPVIFGNVLTFNSLIVAWATNVNIHPRNSFFFDIMHGRSPHLYKNPRTASPTESRQKIEDYNEKIRIRISSAFDKAKIYYNQMRELRITPNAKSINTLLHLAIHCGRHDEAISMYNDLRQRFFADTYAFIRHTQSSLTPLASSPRLLLYQPFHDLSRTFEDIATKPQLADIDDVANPKAMVDILTMNTLLALYTRFRDLKGILQVMNDMERMRQEPNEWTLVLLIHGLVRRNAQLMDGGESTVRWVLETADQLEKSGKGIQKDGLLETELAKLERWDGANSNTRSLIHAFRSSLKQ